jgi:hypothetical protein
MALKKPIKAQLDKLPAWAREYVKALELQRDEAIKVLNRFVETQTPTDIFLRDIPVTGEETGPVEKRCYLQTKRVYFRLPCTPEEFELEIFVNAAKRRVEVRTPRCYPYIEPQGNNLFYIVPREEDTRPNAKLILQAMQEADTLDHDNFTSKYGFSQAAIPQMIDMVIGKRNAA